MLFNTFQCTTSKTLMPSALIRSRGLPPSTHACTYLHASTHAWVRAAVHALASKTEFSVPESTAAPRRNGDVHADGDDRGCEKAPRFAASRRQIPAAISASFVRDIRLLGFRFSLFRHTRCGRRFRGREAAAPDPPSDRYGRKVVEGEGAPCLSSVRSAHRRSAFTRLCR